MPKMYKTLIAANKTVIYTRYASNIMCFLVIMLLLPVAVILFFGKKKKLFMQTGYIHLTYTNTIQKQLCFYIMIWCGETHVIKKKQKKQKTIARCEFERKLIRLMTIRKYLYTLYNIQWAFVYHLFVIDVSVLPNYA